MNTAATMWAAIESDRGVQSGLAGKWAYGAVQFSKTAVDFAFHTVMKSAGNASTVADMLNQKIDETGKASDTPPSVASMLEAIKVEAAGDEMVIKARVNEQDLMGIIMLVLDSRPGP